MTKDTVTYRFPEGFWWGSATSATQTEGATHRDGKGKNIWDHWYEVEPSRFFQGVGPQDTSQFYERYKEDIQLMKEVGHNSFRFSISWSRLIPDGRGEVNPKGVEFYNNVIDELLGQGIEPFVNLFHFDMPMELQKIGGWANREVVDAYEAYAKTCFERFGDRVKKWFTHNEPIVPVEGGYLYDFHYPNEVDFEKAIQVGYHTVLSSAKAIRAYKQLNQGGKIGIILNLTPSYPRSNHPADLKAAKIADAFFNRSFLDPSVKGEFPEELVQILKEEGFMPIIEEEDLEIIRQHTVDLLGVNYYQPRRVKAKETLPNPDAPFMPERYFDHYAMPGRKMNVHRGWEIYEKGIYDILINLKEHYGNIECFISENGMGVEGEEKFRDENGVIHDDYRIEFIQDHLKWVHRAIQEGSNVKGYHLWTFMDNWSWANAYKNRYGLVSVNLDKNGERTIKKSGKWYKTLSENNGF
ncbi:glycoside hydrolase family 1 protein [Halalkalibacterium halodurans]|jgi:6-phospho-beta-glucosidase|uniref:Beta-glucosidase n=2 Tax=Halalkalibacterium halodurans TaxID=86665 RepID=Q9K615_HALH5|nr:glycoside hydrolase family 1 protein [Halalkalibacterium halodurans]MDY7224425.1 glycoside hydrolase family 1 protein [Halalkalibacterium halodurans]MDY7243710.1 glycoside hydrolase family 1 protein [Halalkalibacterium halodurans]MED4123229.1 glycoside hydrolase family 1 protein [Halalkalibacterium halodurans]MED4172081.1 glycoside hydrolase family 1 protein [Halalkalibacterium halodurans]TPE69249.1 glycoside hydrolase family 1 protein [Halalkalibacterium halodurans]